jgi:hypothetical protein
LSSHPLAGCPNYREDPFALPREVLGHPDASAAVQEVLERLEAQLTPPTPLDEDWYGWVPLRLPYFVHGMLIARDVLGSGFHRFLEVGSGIGTKLALARVMDWQPYGIERYLPYLEVCRRVFPHVNAEEGNAETFEDYGDFDLVYMCRVAPDDRRQEAITCRAAELMRSGAVLFAPSVSGPWPPDWMEHVAGHVWRRP